MERLAKDKIAKQEKLEILRQQMSKRFENMNSTIQLPDSEDCNGIRERGLYSHQNTYIFFWEFKIWNIDLILVPSESLSEQSLPSRVRWDWFIYFITFSWSSLWTRRLWLFETSLMKHGVATFRSLANF